jgi:hypothetical protein
MAVQTVTGGEAADRLAEARRIMNTMGLNMVTHRMNPREKKFVNDLIVTLQTKGDNASISPKQVFWLRDLKDKYLD